MRDSERFVEVGEREILLFSALAFRVEHYERRIVLELMTGKERLQLNRNYEDGRIPFWKTT